MKVSLPTTPLEWVASAVIVVLLAGGFLFIRVAVVDGDSMIPLTTGDRLIVVKGLTPRDGDIVLFKRPGDSTPQVKLVVETTPGTPCDRSILRPGEIYVEGTNPLSEKVGIIPVECVIGVVKAVLVFPHGEHSTVELEDGPPAERRYELRELSSPPDRVSHIAGKAMSVCGDARKFFPKGATIVTETMGDYQVVESYLVPPNEESLEGGTVIIVDPADFAPPGEERIVEIKGP